MKNKTRYSCPFCGSECKRNFVPVILNSGYVEYNCTNESCGAIMSFYNAACVANHNLTDRWFFSRYLGGDSDAE